MSDDAGGPTDWVSGERVFGPPGGTLDVDWLVPLLLESAPDREGHRPPTRDAAAAALRQVWDAVRLEAARAGVPAREVGADVVSLSLCLLPPGDGRAGASLPPPPREGDDLLRRAVTVVTAAVGAYDAR